MTRVLAAFGLAATLIATAAAADDPTQLTLSGRVVDGAGVLSVLAEQALVRQLEEHERRTTNQIVVATLRSLEGRTIEDVGYRLGRRWELGQKGKSNGAILLVAPAERQVRIEVGYGLEGQLTDALARTIIEAAILPHFRKGDVAAGIEAGVTGIVHLLEGGAPPTAPPKPRPADADEVEPVQLIGALVFALFVLFLWMRLDAPGRYGGGVGPWGRGAGGFDNRGFGGGGGFRGGGGGGFGGGGASGRW